MTYRKAMNQKCKCGEFSIGGWFGDKKTGKSLFSRVSSPVVVPPGIGMCEEHTVNVCYAPHQIVRKQSNLP